MFACFFNIPIAVEGSGYMTCFYFYFIYCYFILIFMCLTFWTLQAKTNSFCVYTVKCKVYERLQFFSCNYNDAFNY